MNVVKFPGLNLEFKFSNIAFNIFGISIYKYAICIVLGILIGFIICYLNRKRFDISFEFTLNTLIIGLLFGLIGARIYYIIFNFANFSKNILDIFNFRDGGLAIYGGLISGGVAILIICKKKKQNICDFLDYIAPSVAIAQFVGRIGNFFNIEAYGIESKSILRMGIFTDCGYKEVHPTFLYEMIVTFFIFVILIFFQKRRKFKGEIFLSYCVIYSFFRFFIEALRYDSLMLFDYRISQILSIIIFSLSILLIICRKLSYEKSLKC